MPTRTRLFGTAPPIDIFMMWVLQREAQNFLAGSARDFALEHLVTRVSASHFSDD
jgi:hypothetical protein